jgi:hypothetical protein
MHHFHALGAWIFVAAVVVLVAIILAAVRGAGGDDS